LRNAIRPTALGKKNWLFFGDADAGERSSIIESCRRHGIEPQTYLHDVLRRLPSMNNRQVKDIVPKAWAAAPQKHST
jgi:transposase